MARGAAGHRRERDSPSGDDMAGGGVRIFPRRKLGEESSLAPKKNRSPVCFDMETIGVYFDVPQSDAAKNLGISLTALKQVCRKLGLSRWPYVRPKKSKGKGQVAPGATPAAATTVTTDVGDAGGDSSEREDDCMSSAGSTTSYSSAETTRASSGGLQGPHANAHNPEEVCSTISQQPCEADAVASARPALPHVVLPSSDVDAMLVDNGDDMSWLVPPTLPIAENPLQPTAYDLEKETRWWQQYCENDAARLHDRHATASMLPVDDAGASKAALLALCFGA